MKKLINESGLSEVSRKILRNLLDTPEGEAVYNLLYPISGERLVVGMTVVMAYMGKVLRANGYKVDPKTTPKDLIDFFDKKKILSNQYPPSERTVKEIALLKGYFEQVRWFDLDIYNLGRIDGIREERKRRKEGKRRRHR